MAKMDHFPISTNKMCPMHEGKGYHVQTFVFAFKNVFIILVNIKLCQFNMTWISLAKIYRLQSEHSSACVLVQLSVCSA